MLAVILCACSESGPPRYEGTVQEGASLLTDVKISEINENKLKWTLLSKTARFEDGETMIYFDNPKIDMFENNKLASKLNAESGFLNMIRNDARLEKSVRVVSEADGMVLLTSKLFFSSEKNKIWTDDPVTILKGNSITHGRGITANPDLSEIEITQQETTTPGNK
jgi:LPS export ABC transporter protein LptC